VIQLANIDQYLDAANTRPSARTAEQRRLVEDGKNIQAVRNADEEAKRLERIYGTARN
jgi:hypothetical protein